MTLLISCSEQQEYKVALTHAIDSLEESPDSSLAILDTLGKHSSEFDTRFKMRYELVLTYAQAKTGIEFKSDSLTSTLVDYFDAKGSRTEQALANYMNGCALSDIGQSPEALQAFYDAIDKIDTTKRDCTYNILKGIYGQMALIFHRQNLPQDEIWALNRYIDCVRRTSSERDYIIAKGQMIRPYYLLGEKDKVLRIINDEYLSLKKIKEYKKAVSAFGTAVQIYTERGQMQEAKKAINAFEHESGLFDKKRNVIKGREGYYFIKGNYELALKNLRQAEDLFRKAIHYGYLSEGYKGLLHVYRLRNNVDSVLLFSELYEAAQDSLHNKMQTEAIHQMSALYNYSRSQKEAELEKEKSARSTFMASLIFVIAVIVIGIVTFIYLRREKKRKQKIVALTQDLYRAKKSHAVIFEELQQLKSHNYEDVIAAKESKLAELKETIDKLQTDKALHKANSMATVDDNFERFLSSDIARLFVKKATEKTEKVQPTEAEWRKLISQFSSDNLMIYKSFGSGKALSKLELRICILLVLDIPEYVISLMTNSSASTVSNSKARANEKLFGKKDAHPLKINLVHALKSH